MIVDPLDCLECQFHCGPLSTPPVRFLVNLGSLWVRHQRLSNARFMTVYYSPGAVYMWASVDVTIGLFTQGTDKIACMLIHMTPRVNYLDTRSENSTIPVFASVHPLSFVLL